jgi:plasmid stabilization system protein ParE
MTDDPGKYCINITVSADIDLDNIFAHVARELRVPGTALKLVERLHEAIFSLSSMPARCPLSKDPFLAKQGFRILLAENYIVFFTIHETPSKQVVIHRVIYAKRNYAELF